MAAQSCFTRCVKVRGERLGRKLYPYRWIWRGLILAALLFWAWRAYAAGPAGLIATLVGLVALALVAEVGPIFMDLPVLLWLLALWGAMSLAACLDVVLRWKMLRVPKNRIAIKVFAINVIVGGIVAAYMAAWPDN